MNRPNIFYFVHAHGNGHQATFNMLYPALSLFFEVIAITTNPLVSNRLVNRHKVKVVELPAKYPPDYEIPEHTFSKAFEVTPYTTEATIRAKVLAEAVIRYQPRTFYCDGVPELAILIRGMGVPVTLVHLPGNKFYDPTQVFAYELADHVIAHFPFILEQPDYRYTSKTSYSGYLSKYAQGNFRLNIATDIHQVTILLGYENYDAMVIKQMTQDQQTTFTIIGNKQIYDLGPNCRQLGFVKEISDAITGTVVITAAGQNTVAELLSLKKRLILLPEPRPYNEQAVHANMLSKQRVALLAQENLQAWQWNALIQQAKTFEPAYKNLINTNAPTAIAEKMREWYG